MAKAVSRHRHRLLRFAIEHIRRAVGFSDLEASKHVSYRFHLGDCLIISPLGLEDIAEV